MKYRDCSIIPLNHEYYLAVACDICAGIGEQAQDSLHVPYPVLGRFALRTPLMEMFALGAKIQSVIVSVGNPLATVGTPVMRGIQEELAVAGLSGIDVNGSTEENMVTFSTSVTTTVIGLLPSAFDFTKRAEAGNRIYRVGMPLVGSEVLQYQEDIVTYAMMQDFMQRKEVSDILPIGSKGTVYECSVMAKTNGLSYVMCPDVHEDYKKSGGPSTSVLVAVKKEGEALFSKSFPQAMRIGMFTEM